MLRLTEKGRDFFYNPQAELDCCHDARKLNPLQSQYLANWHDSFVNWVNSVLGMIGFLSIQPMVTDEDKLAIAQCAAILNGHEVRAVEESLSNGVVTKDVLDKIERLNKKLVDTIVGHVNTEALVKEFLKCLCYLKIEQDKSAEEKRLSMLGIPEG